MFLFHDTCLFHSEVTLWGLDPGLKPYLRMRWQLHMTCSWCVAAPSGTTSPLLSADATVWLRPTPISASGMGTCSLSAHQNCLSSTAPSLPVTMNGFGMGIWLKLTHESQLWNFCWNYWEWDILLLLGLPCSENELDKCRAKRWTDF